MTFRKEGEKLKTEENEDDRHSRWSKKINMRLQIKRRAFGFFMNQVLAAAVLVVIPLISYHYYELDKALSSKKQLTNVMNLYTKTADLMNTNLILQYSLISTILWNNSLAVNSSHIEAGHTFKIALARLRNYIIPEMELMSNTDMGGDFNSFIKGLLTEKTICDLALSQSSHYTGCDADSNGELKVTFIKYLRSVVSITEDAFSTWEQNKENPKIVSEIFADPRFVSYLAWTYGGGVMRDIYYSILVPLSNTLKVLIDPTVSMDRQAGKFTLDGNKSTDTEYYLIYVLPLTLFLAATLFSFVYLTMLEVFTCFWTTPLLFPIDLILKNQLFCKYLRELEHSTKSRISFF